MIINKNILEVINNYSHLGYKDEELDMIIISLMQKNKITDIKDATDLLIEFFEKKSLEKINSIEGYIKVNFSSNSALNKTKFDDFLLMLDKNNWVLTIEESQSLITNYQNFNRLVMMLSSDVSSDKQFNVNESTLFEAYFLTSEKELVNNQKDSGDSFSLLKEEMKFIPVLTNEQLKKLFQRYEESGKTNIEIRNEIAEHNIKLVVSIAKKFGTRGIEFQDLIQEGTIGLLIAIDKFDYKKDIRFSTYATWWIKQKINLAVYDKSRVIRVPVHVFVKNRKISKCITDFEKESGVQPTVEELCELTNFSKESIEEYFKNTSEIVSLNKIVGSENNSELESFVAEKELTHKNLEKKELLANVLDFINASNLSEQEKEVIFYRYGFYGEKLKLDAVGEIYGVTRERIRQIEAMALKKLQNNPYNELFQSYISKEELQTDYDSNEVFKQIKTQLFKIPTSGFYLANIIVNEFEKEEALDLIKILNQEDDNSKSNKDLKDKIIKLLFHNKIIEMKDNKIFLSHYRLERYNESESSENLKEKEQFILDGFLLDLIQKNSGIQNVFIDIILSSKEPTSSQNALLDYYGLNSRKECLSIEKLKCRYNITDLGFAFYKKHKMQRLIKIKKIPMDFKRGYLFYQRNSYSQQHKSVEGKEETKKYTKRKEKLPTVYEQFSEYDKSDIDYALSILEKEVGEELKLRYGQDYNKGIYLTLKEDFEALNQRIYNLIKKVLSRTAIKNKYKTVYEQFSEYNKSDIDYVINLLEKRLFNELKLRYGNDYEKRCNSTLSDEEFEMLNQTIYNLIKKRLEKERAKKKPNDKRLKYTFDLETK